VVNAVHGDVTALLDSGVVNRNANGTIEFPYESVRVEFLLHAAQHKAPPACSR
jgi:predicted transcriptional regulator